jgi:sialic acid synthase SpsE
MVINRDIFEDLFVLEMANNHWGRIERARRIVDDYARVVRYNNIRAAIKFQLRDVETFIHPDHADRRDVRYIKKTMDTWMSAEHYAQLTAHIRKSACIPMATPFDEASVDLCVELGIPILKLASSDLNDWVLIEKIASTRLPVIASTGGSSQKDVDDLVTFFSNRDIPLALNHCVSLYPSEDGDLELNQIDYLVNRYPGITVGFSTHECNNWEVSVAIAYAKGARTFERHVDIETDDVDVSPYCSLPEQVDTWFKAFNRAKAMCGGSGRSKRVPSREEIEYLDGLVRGVYARHDLPVGHELTDDDYFLAIPLLKGQLSCRELFRGEALSHPVAKNEPISIEHLDNPYSRNPRLGALIRQRGIDPL